MSETHAFELLRDQQIAELNTRARLYRHILSGAELLSLENDDENKVFAVTLRTPPADSSGVAHILEHSVLCGSPKYPVKEPFVELVKGSLNTFLNAFTYPDKTCYPTASQNLQDFYNLIDVYMDAVLHPFLAEHTFQQEGWHLELDQLDAPLAYKGVVFNEMKGVYSDPESQLDRQARQALFPDTPYGVDSGGDPQVIPDLTYQAFKEFHASYYHPSNARIYFYGNDDPQERLRLMEGYLQEYTRQPVRSAIPLQPRIEGPRRQVVHYHAGEEGGAGKAYLLCGWMLDETGDAETMLGLSILDYILIHTPASPLRKALIDSGLGEDLAGGGLDGELRQAFFSTGLKGVTEARLDQVEPLILTTLQSLSQEGIDPGMVEAAVNTTEFRLRENNTGSFPRGLVLLLRSLTTWLYDGDPFVPLAFEAPLASIKQRLASGEHYFEGLLQHYLLDNRHRVTTTLLPDPQLGAQQEALERSRLDQIRSALSPQELQALVENTRQLKLRQETPDTPQALATIPTLKLSDLDPQARRIPLQAGEWDGAQILFHDLFTNGILYLDLGFNLRLLPQDLLPYVPLFGRALVEMGTEQEDFVHLSQRIGRLTGGIHATRFTSAVHSSSLPAAYLFLRGKSTVARVADLLAVLQDVLTSVHLDNPERFRQMVLEEKASLESALVPAGHGLVNTRLRGQFNLSDWAAEQMGGISYLFFLRELAERLESEWSQVLQALEKVRSSLLNRSASLVNVTLDGATWQAIQPQVQAFLSRLPSGPVAFTEWQLQPATPYEGLAIPAKVNYVGKGANLYQLGYQLDGSALVISNYLRNSWLWEKVRVQGGAYGAFCMFDLRSGVYTYLSYRDPNLGRTLEMFDGAGGFLLGLKLEPAELVKSIIGTIGDLDAYQLPDAKGYTSMMRYLLGESDEYRQQMREQVLSTDPEDFRVFGETLQALNQAGRVVVLGSEEALSGAVPQLKVQRIM